VGHPNSSQVGEIPEGHLRPQTIKTISVGLYETLKLNGTGSGDCYAELRRIHLLRRWVNKDKRKRLPYILSTQLLPKDILRQELAGCILV
jgi:hypothetical protein